MCETRIAIVDDHLLFRKALIILLQQPGNCRIVFDAGNGSELQQQLGKGIFPDIILLDLRMPVMNGYETLQWLQKNYPAIHVIILSMHETEINLVRLLKAGARAVLKKDISPEELRNAILSVKEKGFYYTNSTTRKLFSDLYSDAGNVHSTHCFPLTEKEEKFLQFSQTELTYKEIAKELKLSPRGVDKIRDRLFFRFGVKNRTSLAIKAMKEGMTLSLFFADCMSPAA